MTIFLTNREGNGGQVWFDDLLIENNFEEIIDLELPKIISAFTIYAELIDMKRFKDLDHLASYVGLVPSKDGSVDREGVKGLTPRV